MWRFLRLAESALDTKMTETFKLMRYFLMQWDPDSYEQPDELQLDPFSCSEEDRKQNVALQGYVCICVLIVNLQT